MYTSAVKNKDYFRFNLVFQNGKELTFDLRKSNIISSTHLLGFNGEFQRTTDIIGECVAYRGTINGNKNSKAFVFIAKNYFRAFYNDGKEDWELRSVSSKNSRGSLFISFKSSSVQEMIASEPCPSENKNPVGEDYAKDLTCTINDACDVAPIVVKDGVTRTLEIATEGDFDYVDTTFVGDTVAALADMAMKMDMASAIYENYFDLQFVVVATNLWTDKNAPIPIQLPSMMNVGLNYKNIGMIICNVYIETLYTCSQELTWLAVSFMISEWD